MNKNILTLTVLAGIAALSGACAPAATKQPTPMASLTPPVAQAPPPGANPGSLYSQAAYPNYLYEDTRARRIGDIVMVNIIEKADAKSKSKTSSNKDNNMNMGVTNLFNNKTVDPMPLSGPLQAVGVDVGGFLGMKGRVGSTPLVAARSNNQFTADVARGCGVPVAKVVNGFGQGRCLTANDALAAGMINGVATFDEVIARMRSKTIGQLPTGSRLASAKAALALAYPPKTANRNQLALQLMKA